MKYPITYAVRTTRAPGETEDTTVPVIIDRVQATDLARVVENCIDRGLIAGLKPTAAQGIAEGVAEQIAKEFTLGRSVAFGQYFYGRPYLGGTTDANGRLTSANGINVRLYKGNAFKLTLDDFSFTFDGSGDSPKIDSVLSDGSGVRGEVVKGSSVKVNGRFLNAAGDTNKVYFEEVGADGAEPVVVDVFTAAGDDILSFECPAALVAGRKYSVKAERIDTNGVTRTTNAKTVTVKAGEPVPEPTITGAKTRGESEGSVNIAGGILDVVGANLETATAVELHSDVQPTGEASLWQTMPATYADGKLTTGELDFDEKPSDGGFVRVATSGGSALYPITYCAH